MRGRRVLAMAAAAMLVAPACAKRVVPPIPESEDYVFPVPAAGELSREDARTLRSAWNDVLAGDATSALRRIEKLHRADGAAAQTAAGYALLRAGRSEDAQKAFAAALARSPSFVPAIVGVGSAVLRRGDAEQALESYKRALGVAPNDPLIRKRVAALKLQVTERHMGRAQLALAGGDAAGSVREYRAALEAAPEVAPVRLALAETLVGQSDPAGAVAALEADLTGDRQVALRLGSLLLAQHELTRAGEVYGQLLARDPGDAAARAGQAAVRDGIEAALMPEEYRRIPDASHVTRADLAALVVVRVKALRRAGAGSGEPRVAVDIAGSWAREQIASALAFEVMDVYPNHTFQPGATVRRVDVARAAARVLDLLRWPRAVAPAPTDVPRSHLDYDAVERVLGAGLMSLTETGAFEPWRLVTGRETLDVVDGLARLVGS